MRTERERLSIGVQASIAVCLVGIAVMFVCGWVERNRAADRVREAEKRILAVGGKFAGEISPDYEATVGNSTHRWNTQRLPRLYRFLWWSYVEELVELRSLDLSGCRLTLDDCRTIAATRNCAILNLRNASLPSEGLACLMAMPIQDVVDLRGVAFSGDVLQALKRYPQRFEVIVSSRAIGSEVVAELKRELPNRVIAE